MTNTYPSELVAARATGGNELDLSRIQNTLMQRALEESRSKLANLEGKMEHLTKFMEARTQVLAPPQGYFNTATPFYGQQCALYLI